jgi:hypothetical protein
LESESVGRSPIAPKSVAGDGAVLNWIDGYRNALMRVISDVASEAEKQSLPLGIAYSVVRLGSLTPLARRFIMADCPTIAESTKTPLGDWLSSIPQSITMKEPCLESKMGTIALPAFPP